MPRSANTGPSQRQLRVGEQVRHALSDLLQRGDMRDDADRKHGDLGLGGAHVARPEDRDGLRLAASAGDDAAR